MAQTVELDNDMQIINNFRYKMLIETFGKEQADEIMLAEGEEVALDEDVETILNNDDAELFDE